MDILWTLVGAECYTEALGRACEYIIFLMYPQQGYPDSTGFIWLLQRQQIVFCFLNLSRKVILRSSVELIFHISLILLWLVSNSTWSASEWGLRKYNELLNEKEFSLGLIISNFDDKNSVKWSVLRIQNHLLRMCCHNSNPCYPWNNASIIYLTLQQQVILAQNCRGSITVSKKQ